MSFDITKMLNPDVYDHPVKNLELIETHISWVVLTGEFAYKIKKPVNFGFLDFSTLDKRRTYCEQEIWLNRRLSTDIYLDVVTITQLKDQLKIGQGKAVEYAIKMNQFSQSSQLDNLLAAGKLTVNHIDGIGQMIAKFHQRTKVADTLSSFGNPDYVFQPVAENFIQINQLVDSADYEEILTSIKFWSESTFQHLTDCFKQRKQKGFIRECHGDMHLRNLLWMGDLSTNYPGQGPMAFDCIEFNENLRWIDVINEVAFLVMDLQDRRQFKFANRFLNRYLEITGDYECLIVLPFYLCYRAMVRAKVSILRLNQQGIPSHETILLTKEFVSYLELANQYTQSTNPKLIIMRGVSASGKSTVSQHIVDELGAIRIRSDVERKRVNIISRSDADLHHKTSNKVNSGLYSDEISVITYAKLLALAVNIISAGYSVVVDAAFLKREQREPFEKLSEKLNIPYIIVETVAKEEVLRQRIVARKNDVSDANLEVLNHQLSNLKPLSENEKNNTFSIDIEEAENIDIIIKKLKGL